MSRSTALANEASHRFIDPISLDLMKDPVLAADGHSYDRQTITQWFNAQKALRRPITSPRTNQRLENDTLTPNTALKRELDKFIASTSGIRPADIRFTLSSEIFKELDRISSMPEMGLLDFEPPKIVVLGNESHGKSTILERVIGLPIFPKEKGICTRCVVRVHMRRCAGGQPSLAEVSVQKLLVEGKDPQTLRVTVPPPLPHLTSDVVALDNIREKIKEVMDDLVRNDPQHRMIIDDHEIIVKINLPYCLNVDILDLPGLVTTSPASTTQNLPQVTKEIAMRVIREQRESSFFLLVNDVKTAPNQSRGCEVVQEAKIEGQTLGIFTKVDTFVSDDGSESAELQQLLDSSRGGFLLGYGWMAAASRSVDVGGTTNKLQAFQVMEQNESRFFREKYGDLVGMNKMGIQQIRQRIQTLYESFIHDRWIPHIRTKLDKYISNFEDQMVELGVPLPRDDDYLELTKFLKRTKIGGNNLNTFDKRYIRTFAQEILQRLLDMIEIQSCKTITDQTFWTAISQYHNFIGQDTQMQKVNSIYMTTDTACHIQSLVPLSPYKYAALTFDRDGPALEMNKARKALDNQLREALNQIYLQLRDRIYPEGNFFTLTQQTIREVVTQVYPNFKLERFDALNVALQRVLASHFKKICDSFSDWFDEFIAEVYEKPLFKSVYYQVSGTVHCQLYWSNPDDLHGYPHMILDQFYQCISKNMLANSLVSDLKSNELKSLKENCKTTRLKYFKEVKKVNEVQVAVEAFAHKVQNEIAAIKRK
eukprot:gene4878-5232_t